MAIALAMNNNESSQDNDIEHEEDDHQNDLVMPGFRFHPTEEELVEFYLRRKVEGKRFNVQLITFLDLYRYDPWELPALAAIGEKEWYFYVPRDRKYRNGDRPNRVTTSGYWKATGADKMIRGENSRSIGLKKTLVFYSGKAPKGIRSSWIMNEYRLPHHETERLQKAEISLCRVYKRPGMEDRPSLPRALLTSQASSSSSSRVAKQSQKHNKLENHQNSNISCRRNDDEKIIKIRDSSPSSSTDIHTSLSLPKNSSSCTLSPLVHVGDHTPSSIAQDDHRMILKHSSHDDAIGDLHKLVNNYNSSQPPINHQLPRHQYFPNLIPSQFSTFEPGHPDPLVPGSIQGGYRDRIWDWSATSETGKDYNNLFKFFASYRKQDFRAMRCFNSNLSLTNLLALAGMFQSLANCYKASTM